MTNSQEKIVSAPQVIEPDLIPGTFDDDAVTRGLLADAIRKSTQSRQQIAERMSWLLSKAVTTDMLNNFTADSKNAHRFPIAWSRAFCQATGDWRLFLHLADQAGFILLPKSDADVVSLGELVVQQKQTEAEIARHAHNIVERRSGRQ
jgi:hypothetical protein